MPASTFGKTNSRTFSPPATSLLLAVTLAVSGCAVGGLNSAKLSSGEQIVATSVTKAAESEGVAQTDAEIIKTAVAAAPVDESNALAWANPQTGSSGTIVAIDKFMGKHGQACRGFKTSVDTFMGIAFYNGEACQISPGEWVLSWFRPSE